MHDVARYASVSIATVSRVINHPERVNVATRQRVQEAIEALGYQVNVTAQQLRLRQPRPILVIISDITYAPLAEAVQAFQKMATAQDYAVVITIANDIDLQQINSQGYAGVFWATCQATTPPWEVTRGAFVQLDPDIYMTAAWEATQYLARLGHRQIGLMTHQLHDACFKAWHVGYQEALQALGLIALDPVVTAPEALLDVLPEWLSSSDPAPSALIASTDVLALSIYRAAKHIGLSIPEMLSVVGLGDTPMAAYLAPPLTTIRLPSEQIGQAAFVQLRHQMSPAKPFEPLSTPVPHLTIRDSTTPPLQASASTS